MLIHVLQRRNWGRGVVDLKNGGEGGGGGAKG